MMWTMVRLASDSDHSRVRSAIATHLNASLRAICARESRLLVGIVFVSIGLRLVSAVVQGDSIVPLPGVYDQVSYDTLARQVLAGRGFTFPVDWWPITRAGSPTAHWSFLYTLYLVAVYAVFGPHPIIARIIQAVVAGVLYPLVVGRLARRMFGARVALVAASLSALYAYFVYYAGALMTETFYILAVIWSLEIAIGIARTNVASAGDVRDSARRFRPGRSWVLLGLAVGTAGLLRQLLLLFIPVLAAWLLLVTWPDRNRLNARHGLLLTLKGLAVTIGVVVVMIAPWTVRNYVAFHRFVPLNTNSGYAFFWGNHPIYGSTFVPILPNGVYQRLIPDELRGLDEAALESALMTRGIGFVLQDPGRYAMLSLSRIPVYFEFWPSADSGLPSNIMRTLSFGIYLPFMLYGLVRALHAVRGRADQLLLICLFGAFYTVVHLLSWALIRYRLPLDGVFMPFAAVGLLDLVKRLRAGALSESVQVESPHSPPRPRFRVEQRSA